MRRASHSFMVVLLGAAAVAATTPCHADESFGAVGGTADLEARIAALEAQVAEQS